MFLKFWLWWEYFKKFFLGALESVFAGRSVKFYFLAIINVIGKWYMLMIPPAVYVVYKLYEALDNAGIIAALQGLVQSTLNTVIYIANNCFQKILNLHDMLNCISTAPFQRTYPSSSETYSLAKAALNFIV